MGLMAKLNNYLILINHVCLFVCSFVSCLALLTAGGERILVSGGGVRNIVQKANRKFGQVVGNKNNKATVNCDFIMGIFKFIMTTLSFCFEVLCHM